MKAFFCSVLSFLVFAKAWAQSDLQMVKEVIVNGKMLEADRLGNVYVVKKNNEVIRLDEKGDSTAVYFNETNGALGGIDVANPMKPMLFYPEFSKVVVLDKLFAAKNEVSLREMGFANPTALAQSVEGRWWVYDASAARLKLVDEQMAVVAQTGDLRQELGSVSGVCSLAEGDWKVFVCDSVKGVHVFDFSGNYLNTLSIFTKKIKAGGGRLTYFKGEKMYGWTKLKSEEELFSIPQRKAKVLDAAIAKDRVVVLYEDRLVFYEPSPAKAKH